MSGISKILYVHFSFFPGPKANHAAIAKMVDAFSKNLDVTLLLRRYKKGFTVNAKNYFGLEKDMDIRHFFSLNFPYLNFPPVHMDFVAGISLSIEFNKLFRDFSCGEAVVYYRYSKESGKIMANFARRYEIPFFTEVHTGFGSQKAAEYLKEIKGIVVISNQIRNRLLDLGFESERILLAPSGVDIRRYESKSQGSKEQLRNKLSLPTSKNLVVYTGKPYKHKGRGVETLLESAKFLDDSTLVLIVGALPDDLKRIDYVIKENNLQSKIRIEGHKPSSEIPLYQMAADVLVMPYSADWNLRKWASPVKMFEYMASRNPIVATDFPNIREVLNSENSVLVPPDDPQAIAMGIRKCLENKEFANSIAAKAREQVGAYSWENRAKKIMDFMNSLL